MNNNPAILSAVLDLDIEGIVLETRCTDRSAESSRRAAEREEIYPGKRFSPVGKISAGGYGDKRLSPKESEVLRLFAEGFR